ncbi:MAG: (2Fe-2S)-binding protein [Chloroflexi bacterium]|nr:(2Fe-2S)-binding protein [Chloroflexota bacterium]
MAVAILKRREAAVKGSLHADGVSLPIGEGQTILAVLRAAGASLPTLCYDPRLPPQGSCRLCLVQVQGRPQPVAACTTAAEPGMVIATEPPALREYRRVILEMLLSETPPSQGCPRCSLLGLCQLHAAAARYGAQGNLLPRLPTRTPSPDPNPFILRDYRWCIACYWCTRICQEWEMAGAITAVGRGQDTRIASLPTDRLLESPCTFCGQCINTCPTGALMDRKLLGQLSTARASP